MESDRLTVPDQWAVDLWLERGDWAMGVPIQGTPQMGEPKIRLVLIALTSRSNCDNVVTFDQEALEKLIPSIKSERYFKYAISQLEGQNLITQTGRTLTAISWKLNIKKEI